MTRRRPPVAAPRAPYPKVVNDAYYTKIARRHGIPEAQMQDCIQVMKVRVWLARNTVRNIHAAIGKIAGRAAIDFLRSNNGRRGQKVHEPLSAFFDLAPQDEEHEEPEPLLHAAYASDDGFDTRLALLDVNTAVAALSPRACTILHLSVLYGFSDAEIAVQLNMPQPEVRVALAGALASVRAYCAVGEDV